MKKIDTDCVKEAVIGHRRTIHRLAELGGKEYKTRDYVLEQIRRLGLPYEMVTETALLATLDTGRPGPHIALRADMDALPLREHPENLKASPSRRIPAMPAATMPTPPCSWAVWKCCAAAGTA